MLSARCSHQMDYSFTYAVVFGISLFGFARMFSASFARESRDKIARRPILHFIWFAFAAFVLIDFVVKLAWPQPLIWPKPLIHL